nr:putative receptor-like protein kinase At4g00960 [Ipomoea batatas]
MLRYSDGPVSGRAAGDDDRLATRVLCGKEQNRISQPARFMEWIGKTLEEMTNSLSGGGKKFGTHKGNFTDESETTTTIYSLVQCWPDISDSDCQSCIRRGIQKLQACGDSTLGARVLLPSCTFRYETYRFYFGETASAQPPHSQVDVIGTSTGEFSQYDFATIRAITNDFSLENKIGEGGYGSVYKGMLPIGQEVAVKRLSRSSRQGDQEFKNEVEVVAKLQHKNLAWEHWRDGSPLKILDPTLEKYYAENEVIQCMHIGLLCVQEYANERLTMGEVMCMLNNYSANNWATPHEPAFYGNGSKRMPREIELEQSMTVNEVSISELYPR